MNRSVRNRTHHHNHHADNTDSTTRTTTRRRLRVLAVPAAALLAAGAAGTALAVPSADAAHPTARPATAQSAAGTQEDPRLTGSAKLRRADGDDVRFSFDARFRRDETPDKARGTFAFRHVGKGGSGWAKGRVDCLVTGGKVAVTSGIVTATDIRGLKGKRVGFSVHDVGGRGTGDRLGYSWAATAGPADTKDLPPCVSSAPFETVERGDFTVVPWDEPVG
ncbi:Repetin [Streptomyces sp. NPDC052496]|uniref:Repetin n=1 Tax=Streptomyces sp. NPDC052496 TaxID=3154951 RepID=UPI00341587A4